MTPRYVYIGQFGACFRLTFAQFIELLESGAAGDGYDLEALGAKQLRRFPAGIVLDMRGAESSGRRSSIRSDVVYYEPLDWDEDEFTQVLADVYPIGGFVKTASATEGGPAAAGHEARSGE